MFVHGERNKREFEATWPPTPLAVIPHGDERLFADDPPPPAQEPRILFFGSLEQDEGPTRFDAGIRRSGHAHARRAPDDRRTDGVQEGEAETVLAWAAERSERVEILAGYVPIEDVRDLFARARVVVLPYVTSSQSGVLHLAMTMGRAVVATDVGGLPEAVSDGVSPRVCWLHRAMLPHWRGPSSVSSTIPISLTAWRRRTCPDTRGLGVGDGRRAGGGELALAHVKELVGSPRSPLLAGRRAPSGTFPIRRRLCDVVDIPTFPSPEGHPAGRGRERMGRPTAV